MGSVHNLKLAKLHLVNRSLQDPELGGLLDDLQLCENYVNGELEEAEAREAVDRLAKALRSILGEE